MDALRLLHADHKEVESLFKQLGELGDSAHVSRERIFEQIDTALEAHAKIEETIFYPAIKQASRREPDAKEDVLEAYEEHSNVKGMLEKLKGLDPKDETYEAKLEVLHELVKHHVKEEESSIFADAKELLGTEKLETLGQQMEQTKAKILGQTGRVSKGNIESDVKSGSTVR